MISALSSAVAAPWWAMLLIPAAAVLWWVYRSGDVTRERVLGSTMLLERAKLISRSVKWQPPWRALIEALFLLVLILTLLDIRWRHPDKTYVIAIDNGPRMLTVMANGSSRLAVAKAEAISAASSFESSARFIVITPRLNFTETPVSSGEAQNLIGGINVDYTSGDLMAAASTARIAAVADGVIAIGEGELNLPKPEWLTWHSVDEQPHNNLALTGYDQSMRTAVVTSYSDSESSVELKLTDQAGKIVETRREKIGPGEVKHIQFSENADVVLAGSVLLKSSNDALSLDNANYFAPINKTDLGIIVDSPLSLQELGLESSALTRFKFTALTNTVQTSSIKVELIHHRTQRGEATGETCDGRRLVVMPDNLGEVISKSEKITWWSENDELLRYADLSLLNLPASKVFTNLGEHRVSLIATNPGSVMTRSINGSCDIVTVGFELFPFSTESNRTLGILTLNLLAWLDGSQTPSLTLSKTDWRVDAKSNLAARMLALEDGFKTNYQAGELVSAPGLYFITGANSKEFKATSLVSPAISNLKNIAIVRAVIEPANVAINRERSNLTNHLWWILYAALGLLALDTAWMFAHQRSVKRRLSA